MPHTTPRPLAELDADRREFRAGPNVHYNPLRDRNLDLPPASISCIRGSPEVKAGEQAFDIGQVYFKLNSNRLVIAQNL